MNALVGILNKEKPQVGAFSVIVKSSDEPSFEALIAAAGRGSLHPADHRTATMRGWEVELSPATKTETFFSLFLATRL